MSAYWWGVLTLPGILLAARLTWWLVGIVGEWATAALTYPKVLRWNRERRDHLGAVAYAAKRALVLTRGHAAVIVLWGIDNDHRRWALGRLQPAFTLDEIQAAKNTAPTGADQ